MPILEALDITGRTAGNAVIEKALEGARELIWDQGDSILYQPCVSPNWDTALAAKALIDSGIAGDHPALRGAAKWLIEHQIFKPGDWSIKRPGLEPGGWAFQFHNDRFPDVDDSAVILMVLAEAARDDEAARDRALKLGANWVMGMQSKDGGFAAVDADNDSHWINQAPFADVEAATDPTCADLTGRVLEMMAAVGYRSDHPVARRAIAWLKRDQKSDGSWWGRWGVSYLYGTFSALSGLRAIGADMSEPWIAIVHHADMPGPRHALEDRREAVHCDQRRGSAGLPPSVELEFDPIMVWPENLAYARRLLAFT